MVRKLLLHSDVHKSRGLDGIHPLLLRELAEVLSKLLSITDQQTWLSGEGPVNW